MIWIINIGFFLILTCLTGSICMAIWLVAAFILQKRGSAQAIYRLLKLVMWGYTMPLVYLIFFGWNRLMTSEGWVLVTTPKTDMILRAGFILWLIGMAAYTLIQLPMVLQFKYMRRSRIFTKIEVTAIMDRLKKEIGIRKNIVLYQGYAVVSPFTCGFRRTEIYLPVRNFSERELEIVLRHELIHQKQRDTFWKPAFAIVNGLFWFNPLVWFVSNKMQKWAEASCDEACCRNGLTAKEYFGIIMDIVESETRRSGAYSPLWSEGAKELRWRVHCIDRNPDCENRKSLAAVAAAMMMIIGSCLSVGAATLSANEVYDELFRDTRNPAKESALTEGKAIEHTGTAAELFEGLTVEEVLDAKGKRIDCTIKSKTVKETASFNKKNGDVIKTVGIVEPDDVTVQIGIIEPDGNLRYVDVKNSFSHKFKLTKKGSYTVYIENSSNTTITLVGGNS